MVKANRGQISSALRALDPGFRGVLVFGRDEGLIRERADRIAAQIVDDPGDPFRVARLGPDEVKADRARIADEMAAISLMGGRRLVRVDSPGDGDADAVATALDGPVGDSLLLLVAGDLSPRSKLRKLAEQRKDMLALACYPDEAADLSGLIGEVLGAAGLTASSDARAYLLANLGGDRMLSRRELEKLALYKGDGEDRTVSLADAEACVGDGSALTLSQIAEAVTGGDAAGLDRRIERAFAAGENAVAILRTVQRRLQQFHLMAAHMDAGLDAKAAMMKLAPPPIWKDRERIAADIRRWSAPRLSHALARTLSAEVQCKTTGLPAESICHRTCMEIALAARRPPR